MITKAQIKALEKLVELPENDGKSTEELANQILDPKNKARSYDFKVEFERYQEVLIEAVSEDCNRTILINQFDEDFGKRTIAEFKKLGYSIRPAKKSEVMAYRISDEEYEHKYSAFIIKW
jgi:hypothetical protein